MIQETSLKSLKCKMQIVEPPEIFKAYKNTRRAIGMKEKRNFSDGFVLRPLPCGRIDRLLEDSHGRLLFQSDWLEEPLLNFAKGPIQNEMECNKAPRSGGS